MTLFDIFYEKLSQEIWQKMFRLGKKTLVFDLDFRDYIARKKMLMCPHRMIQKHLWQVSESLNLA